MHVYILWHSSSSKEILGILAVGWKWLFSFQNISLPLMGSFTIWNARYSSDWSGGAVLKPWRAESPVMNQTIIHHICILMFLLSWLIATDALPLSWGSVPGLGVICDVSNWIQLQKHAVYWKCTTLNNKLVLSLPFGWDVNFEGSVQKREKEAEFFPPETRTCTVCS